MSKNRNKSTQLVETTNPTQLALNDNSVPPTETTTTSKTTETTQSASKKKRAAIIRVTHPALKPDANGTATTKLSAYPDDWSSIYHKALTKDNFESEFAYLTAQAGYYDRKAAELRQAATDVQNGGGSETTRTVKKVRSILTSLPTMLSELAGKGVNIDDLVKALQTLEVKETAKPDETAKSAKVDEATVTS